MESYLMITQLNDFIFCPRSIFFAGIYRESVSDELYHEAPQRKGSANHSAIDENRYSSRSNILTGTTVYSEKYNLLGRIDIFDTSTGVLTERKYSVTAAISDSDEIREFENVIKKLKSFSLQSPFEKT